MVKFQKLQKHKLRKIVQKKIALNEGAATPGTFAQRRPSHYAVELLQMEFRSYECKKLAVNRPRIRYQYVAGGILTDKDYCAG